MRLGSTEGEVIPWDYDADMVLVLPLELTGWGFGCMLY